MGNTVMPDKEILDATQDAVLGAAKSVVDVLENTAHEVGAHAHEQFYLEAEFWVGAAFVLTVSLLFRPVGKLLLQMLRKRGEMIADRIREAVTLKEDAQKLLAEYERKFRGAEKEAADMLKRSEQEVDFLKKDTLLKLEKEMQKKEQEAEARLKLAQENAESEVISKASDVAMMTVKKFIDTKMTPEMHSKLIDKALDDLKTA